MIIYFLRHGEGLDDVYHEYGGWSDRSLSPKGVQFSFKLAAKIKKLAIPFNIVLTSPLKRSYQTADIVATELGLRVVEEPYLKERNTYGLLSGVNIDIAKEDYPKLVDAFNHGRYIPSAERYGDFKNRVGILLTYLSKQPHSHMLCVTHGHLITVIAEEHLGLNRDVIGNGCILGIELAGQQKTEAPSAKLVYSDNITFVPKGTETTHRRRMKFKEE